LAVYLKITEAAQTFGLVFFHGQSCAFISTKKTGWATFRATLLQTHLVTLRDSEAENSFFHFESKGGF
jgi:hypothetical protein